MADAPRYDNNSRRAVDTTNLLSSTDRYVILECHEDNATEIEGNVVELTEYPTSGLHTDDAL